MMEGLVTCNALLNLSNIEYDLGTNSDLFPRISTETLSKIITDGSHKPHYQSYRIIDCRFKYEYDGGHIIDALNLRTQNDINKSLIQNPLEKCLLIFYCEFSARRSPSLASQLRCHDRTVNYEEYPKLCYPDIVILEGGYEKFFRKYPQLCSPMDYVPMDSKNCDKEIDIFRLNSKYCKSNTSIKKLNLTYLDPPPKLSFEFNNSSDENISPSSSVSQLLLMDGLPNGSYMSDEQDNNPTSNSYNNSGNSPIKKSSSLTFV